jgi:hypothetical protein
MTNGGPLARNSAATRRLSIPWPAGLRNNGGEFRTVHVPVRGRRSRTWATCPGLGALDTQNASESINTIRSMEDVAMYLPSVMGGTRRRRVGNAKQMKWFQGLNDRPDGPAKHQLVVPRRRKRPPENPAGSNPARRVIPDRGVMPLPGRQLRPIPNRWWSGLLNHRGRLGQRFEVAASRPRATGSGRDAADEISIRNHPRRVSGDTQPVF